MRTIKALAAIAALIFMSACSSNEAAATMAAAAIRTVRVMSFPSRFSQVLRVATA